MVELLVAVSLFAVIASISIGGFVRALRTQRQVAALIAANSNVSIALEQIAREIRTGSLFCTGVTSALCPTSSHLAFVNARAETVVYRLFGGAVERLVVGGIFQKITGGNVSIRYLRFVLFGNLSTDTYPPRVTIAIGVSAKEVGVSGTIVRFQTTISSRVLD